MVNNSIADMVIDAENMTIRRRQQKYVIHHTSLAFSNRLYEAGY